MDMFQKARGVLQGVEAAAKALEKALASKCDWDDPDDVALYRHSVRAQERDMALQALVPTRRCPSCHRGPLDSRQFVVNRRMTAAVCRSCYSVKVQGVTPDVVEIFAEPELRFKMDGTKLVKARRACGVSQTRFAQLAGWSRTWQGRIEGGPVLTVDEATARTILQVFRELGREVKDIEGRGN